ncbi:hypothetical protein B0H34DRAFT_476753 [Crassisporium funariophilum]|nr:hypothetical protein B0H34DRAFT_476753 [Crassisporium funariophilum]
MEDDLPFELEDLIFSYLHDDPSSLKASSLVCRRFAAIAKKHLFASVTLHFSVREGKRRAAEQFRELLFSSPRITHLVEGILIVNLDSIGRYTCLHNDTILPECLPLLGKLKTISITCQALSTIIWTAMSIDVQRALQDSFRSQSLVDITLKRVTEIPLLMFDGCPALESLTLEHVTFRKDHMLQLLDGQWTRNPSASARPRLQNLSVALSDPLFRFFAEWMTSPVGPLDIVKLKKLSVSLMTEYGRHPDSMGVGRLLEACKDSLELFCFSPHFEVDDLETL